MKKLFLVLLFALSFSAFAKEYKLVYNYKSTELNEIYNGTKNNDSYFRIIRFETEDEELANKILRDFGFTKYAEKEMIVLTSDNVLDEYNKYKKSKRISALKTNSVGEETNKKSKGTATASTRASEAKADVEWED